MSKTNVFLPSVNAGEMSTKLDSRIDFEKYPLGAKRLKNALLKPTGAWYRRPGLRHIAAVKDFGVAEGGVLAATVCATPATTTGSQDITVAGLGWTPKAARIFYAKNVTVSGDLNCNGSVGVTDGTNQWCVAFLSEDSSTERHVRCSSSKMVIGLNPGGSFIDQAAEFEAFIPNGIRLHWTAAPSATTRIVVALFGGNGVQAKAGVVEDKGAGQSETVTTGFKVDAGFFASGLVADFDEEDNGVDYHFWSHGYYANTSSEQVASVYWHQAFEEGFEGPDSGSAGSNDVTQIISTSEVSRFWTVTDNGSASVKLNLSASAVDPQIDQPDEPGDTPHSFHIGYLVLSLGDGNAAVSVEDSPVATGSYSLDNGSFEPQYTEFCSTNLTDVDTDTTDDKATTMSISAVTDQGIAGVAFWVEDTASAAILFAGAKRFSECQAFNVYSTDGTNQATRGNDPSITSTGIDLTITAVADTTVRKWPTIFIG